MKKLSLLKTLRQIFAFLGARCDMQSHGYEVVVVSGEPSIKDLEFYRSNKIKYLIVKYKRTGTNLIGDFSYYRQLRKIFNKEKPEIVMTMAIKPCIYGGIAAKKAKSKFYPFLIGLSSIFTMKSLKMSLARAYSVPMFKKSFKYASTVFSHNQEAIDVFKKNKIIKKQKIKILGGSGVNLEHFYLADLPSEPSFIFVGRILRDKGIYEFIEASKKILSEFPNTKISILGDFDSNPSSLQKDKFEKLLSGTKINYCGFQDDVRPFLKQHSVFVLPSYHEGTPKSTLEAMAMGRVILTTTAPGCDSTVIDGVNGFKVPVGDSDALYQKMKYFINNANILKQMSIESRTIAKEKYDVVKVNNTILDVLGEKND